jgi:hypothetical protein
MVVAETNLGNNNRRVNRKTWRIKSYGRFNETLKGDDLSGPGVK